MSPRRGPWARWAAPAGLLSRCSAPPPSLHSLHCSPLPPAHYIVVFPCLIRPAAPRAPSPCARPAGGARPWSAATPTHQTFSLTALPRYGWFRMRAALCRTTGADVLRRASYHHCTARHHVCHVHLLYAVRGGKGVRGRGRACLPCVLPHSGSPTYTVSRLKYGQLALALALALALGGRACESS